MFLQQPFLVTPGDGVKLLQIPACTSFDPLWAGVADENQAETMVLQLKNPETFWTSMPLPSVARNHPSWNNDYWRGAVWINKNQMTIHGLRRYGYRDEAEEMTQRTLDAMAYWHDQTGCIYECYDPDNLVKPDLMSRRAYDVSYGLTPPNIRGVIRNYGWSASGFICLANAKYRTYETK